MSKERIEAAIQAHQKAGAAHLEATRPRRHGAVWQAANEAAYQLSTEAFEASRKLDVPKTIRMHIEKADVAAEGDKNQAAAVHHQAAAYALADFIGVVLK